MKIVGKMLRNSMRLLVWVSIVASLLSPVAGLPGNVFQNAKPWADDHPIAVEREIMHKWWCDQHPEQNLCKMWNWHVKLRETEGKIMETEERPKFGPPVHSEHLSMKEEYCKAHDPTSELCKHVAKGNAKRQTKKQPRRKSLLGSLFGVEL